MERAARELEEIPLRGMKVRLEKVWLFTISIYGIL